MCTHTHAVPGRLLKLEFIQTSILVVFPHKLLQVATFGAAFPFNTYRHKWQFIGVIKCLQTGGLFWACSSNSVSACISHVTFWNSFPTLGANWSQYPRQLINESIESSRDLTFHQIRSSLCSKMSTWVCFLLFACCQFKRTEAHKGVFHHLYFIQMSHCDGCTATPV